jgi:hypothetical protein
MYKLLAKRVGFGAEIAEFAGSPLGQGIFAGANVFGLEWTNLKYTKNGNLGGWNVKPIPFKTKLVTEWQTVGGAASNYPKGANLPGGYDFETSASSGLVEILWNHYKGGGWDDITTVKFNGVTKSTGTKPIPGKGTISFYGNGSPGIGNVQVQSVGGPAGQSRWKFKIREYKAVRVAAWKFWRRSAK